MSVVGAQVRAIIYSTSERRYMYLTMDMVRPTLNQSRQYMVIRYLVWWANAQG